MIYDNLTKNIKNIKKIQNKVILHFVNGPYVEIKGPNKAIYLVKFIDKKTGDVKYESTIENNCWCRCSYEYFIDWKIQIFENNVFWSEYHFSAKNRRVYIALDSKALGDSLAWVPYFEEFRKKHECELVVSTFMNDMFKSEYPEIKFINPGDVAENLYAMYKIGLFYNDDNSINYFRNPIDPKSVTLQKMCSDILGLDFQEIRPKIKHKKIPKQEKLKQICIGVHGTAQSKFWNNPTGWQEVVNWCRSKGYIVKLLSKEGDDYMGNKLPKDIVFHPPGPLEKVMEELCKSHAFIGIGSGLSWLSWTLNVPTVLISGFSYKWAEMEDCIRISTPQGKCEGCFNRLRLDPGDWNWCPDHKGTERQFECTKSITGQMVIKELEKFL